MRNFNEKRRSFITVRCDRCNRQMVSYKMSWFNTEIICSICSINEELHPDIDKARTADNEAVRRGDYNFQGIGKPTDL